MQTVELNGEYAYGMWLISAINIGIFMFFALSFLKPKAPIEWRNMGVLTAFFTALFAEMYGFPLTIFILTSWLGEAYPALEPFNHKFGHLWVVVFGGSNFAWFLVMTLSILFLAMGYLLLYKGWKLIHAAKGELVTDGVYAYARHPQYTGLYLIIVAFLIQWPTFPTVIMTPILFIAYTRLAKSEEHKVKQAFAEKYNSYAQQVPAFFPPLSRWKAFLSAKPGKGF